MRMRTDALAWLCFVYAVSGGYKPANSLVSVVRRLGLAL